MKILEESEYKKLFQNFLLKQHKSKLNRNLETSNEIDQCCCVAMMNIHESNIHNL